MAALQLTTVTPSPVRASQPEAEYPRSAAARRLPRARRPCDTRLEGAAGRAEPTQTRPPHGLDGAPASSSRPNGRRRLAAADASRRQRRLPPLPYGLWPGTQALSP